MWAAFNGQARQVEVLELLVAAGADLAAKNTDGCRRAVGRAQQEHTHPSASPTVGDRWTALMLAAKNGHVDAAAALIFAGADISATSNDGYERPTPRRSARAVAQRTWSAIQHATRHTAHVHRDPLAGTLRNTWPVASASLRSTPRRCARCGERRVSLRPRTWPARTAQCRRWGS